MQEHIAALRRELVGVSHRAYERGLVAGISGNNSVRVPGRDAALIKVTGACQGDMTEDDTVLVGLDGSVLEEGRTPSKEVRWHLAIYRANPEVNGIVHVHPPLRDRVGGRGPRAAARAHRRARDPQADRAGRPRAVGVRAAGAARGRGVRRPGAAGRAAARARHGGGRARPRHRLLLRRLPRGHGQGRAAGRPGRGGRRLPRASSPWASAWRSAHETAHRRARHARHQGGRGRPAGGGPGGRRLGGARLRRRGRRRPAAAGRRRRRRGGATPPARASARCARTATARRPWTRWAAARRGCWTASCAPGGSRPSWPWAATRAPRSRRRRCARCRSGCPRRSSRRSPRATCGRSSATPTSPCSSRSATCSAAPTR